MDGEGRKTFYIANIKSVVAYACPMECQQGQNTTPTKQKHLAFVSPPNH